MVAEGRPAVAARFELKPSSTGVALVTGLFVPNCGRPGSVQHHATSDRQEQVGCRRMPGHQSALNMAARLRVGKANLSQPTYMGQPVI